MRHWSCKVFIEDYAYLSSFLIYDRSYIEVGTVYTIFNKPNRKDDFTHTSFVELYIKKFFITYFQKMYQERIFDK